jgi:hypothetical protein
MYTKLNGKHCAILFGIRNLMACHLLHFIIINICLLINLFPDISVSPCKSSALSLLSSTNKGKKVKLSLCSTN